MELLLERVWSAPLKGVSLRLTGGVNVVLGEPSDGSDVLCELCAGVREPRRGRVTIGAWQPSASPEGRRHIASLLAEESIGARGSVRDWVQRISALTGSSSEQALSPCRIRPERELDTLGSAERRELSLCLALAHAAPALVVLHDPLAACAPGERGYVLSRLAELGQSSVVLVTTRSLAEARRLGGSTFLLDRGLLSEKPAAAWPGTLTPGLAVWLAVEADAPRGLVAALARHPDVHELRYDEQRGGHVLLRGADLEQLAGAVARAAVNAGVDVRSLRAHAEDLEAARGAETGSAHAAYRAAQGRVSLPPARASLPPARSSNPGDAPPPTDGST